MKRSLLRTALGFLAMFHFVDSTFAADKIALSCTGTFSSKESGFNGLPIDAQSLVIDLEQGTVTGSVGNFSITKVSDSIIAFKGGRPSDSNVPPMEGFVDRVSGSASVLAWQDKGHALYYYKLSCTRTNPLF